MYEELLDGLYFCSLFFTRKCRRAPPLFKNPSYATDIQIQWLRTLTLRTAMWHRIKLTYVRRKKLTWISSLLGVCSVVFRIFVSRAMASMDLLRSPRDNDVPVDALVKSDSRPTVLATKVLLLTSSPSLSLSILRRRQQEQDALLIFFEDLVTTSFEILPKLQLMSNVSISAELVYLVYNRCQLLVHTVATVYLRPSFVLLTTSRTIP